MDAREKLVELANDVLRYLPWGEIQKDTAERIADRMMDHGVTAQEWISVKDRLPEKEGEYITYTDRGQIHFDCFCIYPNHGTKFWVGGNGKVTHWMEKPQPPKGE